MTAEEGDSSSNESGDGHPMDPDKQTGKGFFSGRSHQSLKTASTASTSVELNDPDDLFDAHEKLSFDSKFITRFWRIQGLLFVKFGSLPSTLFFTVVLVTLLGKENNDLLLSYSFFYKVQTQ